MELLYGRKLLESELPKDYPIKAADVQQSASYHKKAGNIYCERCQERMEPVSKETCTCKKTCAYCRNCIQMGKVRMCSLFYHVPEPNLFQNENHQILAWKGTLSAQQKEASAAIIESIQTDDTRLLWAVAGAGKTEMLFEGIAYALGKNKRVGVVSPRVDVCLELAPRFLEAFPHTPLALLYGGMEKPYAYTQLVIATTHQLFRFEEAFDVLVVDEVDAFPFHLDQSLEFAVDKARKKDSALIYLSATPSEMMQKEVKKNKLAATILPARYHGYQLPVPKTKFCVDWRKKVLASPLKTSFGKILKQKIQANRKFLVFVPNIEWMLKFEKILRKLYPAKSFEVVFASDPLRKEKVSKMREGKLQWLVTSTILERGVTFSNIDVFVLGAEDRIFTEAALVQIAGRAGRSAKYPKGDVLFFHDGQSRAMKKARKQIKQMNHLAKKRGLIE